MALLGLASSLAPQTEPEALIGAWREARGGDTRLGLVTDPRLDLPLQRAILEQLQGIEVLQLCLPRQDTRSRPHPNACSADRMERHAAQKLLLAQIQLAKAFDVPAVIVPWVELELHRSMAEMQRLFARGSLLPLEALDAERASFGQAIVDRLLQWLEPSLLRASKEGVTLQLCTPAIWPHQAPDRAELTQLGGALAGAPLGLLRGIDWAHARFQLRGEEREIRGGRAPLPVDVAALCAASGVPLEAEELGLSPAGGEAQRPPAVVAPLPIAALRLADASGLSLRIPPGLGEIEGAALRREIAEYPATLWLDPLGRGELPRTLDYLEGG